MIASECYWPTLLSTGRTCYCTLDATPTSCIFRWKAVARSDELLVDYSLETYC